jgi:hypothetical protein
MSKPKANPKLPKEAYLSTLYHALNAIRSAKNLAQAQKIASVFHNLPHRLQAEPWDDVTEQAALTELLRSATAHNLTFELMQWLETAADAMSIEWSRKNK